jgi:hypothetical protein
MHQALFLASSLLPFILPTFSLPAPNQKPHHHDPIFTLHDITLNGETIYSTPAHLAVNDATISFNLTNTAVPYTTHCSGTGLRYTDFFYGEIVYKCDAPAGPGVGPNAAANFTFSKPDGVFQVNQTWSRGEHEHAQT